MALSAFKVFNAFTNRSLSETLAYQIEKFNAATRGGLVLTNKRNVGDFSDKTQWAQVADLVRRRDVYGSGAVTEKSLSQLLETSVRVAAGTPPVRIDPAWFEWVNKNPEEGGAIYGQQLAQGRMADMLNCAIGAFRAAIATKSTNFHDITGSANASLGALLTTAAKLGDASQNILCWLAHSKPLFDIWGANLTNATNLFNFGSVNIMQDGFGRIFVMTDSPSLTDATGVDDDPATPSYFMGGLTSGAVVVEDNGDFFQNVETSNGDENIMRTIQSEWSYNVAVKGFAWDKTNGGKSPTTAALLTGSNWDSYATSYKDFAGVLMESR